MILSKRNRAFMQLATALQRGGRLDMTAIDIERAKEGATFLGGNISAIVHAAFDASVSESDRWIHFRDMKEIVSIHQKSSGVRICELNQKRKALGKASGKLGRLIRKIERPIVKIEGPLPAHWFLTQAQRSHVGGAGKTRQPKQEKKSGRQKASQRQQQVTVMRTHT